jgi:glycosyltransferase involved in cell wall biosynthesis
MRIAQIAPIIESVPPTRYGGTERVISALTEELVKRGHEVTLFASGDSQTRAKLVSVYPRCLRESNVENIYGTNIWSLLNVGLAYQESKSFDIIHDHNSQNNPVSLPLANLSETPVVMTLHGPLDGDYGFNKNGEGYEFFEMYNRPHLVTISKQQKHVAPHLNFAGTVYHGLPMRHYPFSKKHDGYLLFVGRVHLYKGVEEKGLLNAIKVAKLLNMPMYIAAKIDKTSKEDVRYFKQVIQPLLSDEIQFLGEVDETMRNELMSRALCVLHPTNFAEPFGLTIIESMACGAPVIGFHHGSIPEIIADGVSGYVVESIEEMARKVKDIEKISRVGTREYALEHFSVEKMVDGYERIYDRVLSLRQQHVVQAPKLMTRASVLRNGTKLTKPRNGLLLSD